MVERQSRNAGVLPLTSSGASDRQRAFRVIPLLLFIKPLFQDTSPFWINVYGKWNGYVVCCFNIDFFRRIAVTGIFFVVACIISIVEEYLRVSFIDVTWNGYRPKKVSISPRGVSYEEVEKIRSEQTLHQKILLEFSVALGILNLWWLSVTTLCNIKGHSVKLLNITFSSGVHSYSTRYEILSFH